MAKKKKKDGKDDLVLCIGGTKGWLRGDVGRDVVDSEKATLRAFRYKPAAVHVIYSGCTW